MPYRKIDIPPGIDRESTQQSADGAWYEANNMRWRDRNPQTVGGWKRVGEYLLQGIGRGMHSYTDFSGNQYQCIGTSDKFYLVSEEAAYDITPIDTSVGTAGVYTGNLVNTTAGSDVITLDLSAHGRSVGDFVTFTAVAGDIDTIPSDDFLKNDGFKIHEVVSANQVKVTLGGGNNADAGGTPIAVSVTVHVKVPSGTNASTSGQGFGVGPWGGDDFTPTEYALASVYVTTQNNSSVVTIENSTAVSFASGDYIYLKDLVGTAGSLDVTYLNNKWWANTGTGDAVIDLGYDNVTAGDNSGDGTGGNCYRYDLSAEAVVGATRGWGDASASSVVTSDMRTLSIWNFGEDLMFANRGGPIYYWDTDTQTSSGVPAANNYGNTLGSFSGSSVPPTIVDSFIVQEGHGHTIAFGCNDIGSSTQNRMLIRWSERHNPFEWLPAPGNEAGGEVLRHGSSILGAMPTRDEILVFTDHAVYSMRYVGTPEVYGINLVSDGATSYSRMSAIGVDNSVYFMGNEQFYRYDGAVQALPKKMSNFVFDNMNTDQKGKVFVGLNSAFTEVLWFYPSGQSEECNKWVSYNYQTGAWGMGDYDMSEVTSSDITAGITTGYNRTAWQDSLTTNKPMSTYIIQQKDSVVPTISTTGVMVHEFGNNANGAEIVHSIESSEVDIDDGNRYAFYDKIIPDIQTFDYDGVSSAVVTCSVQGRNLPGRDQGTASSVSVDFSANSIDGLNYTPDFNDTTIRGRARSVSISISSTGSGFGWRLGSMKIRFRPDGRD